jgi:hypothetical protein
MLRQIVAERSKDHAIDAVRLSAHTRPGIAGYVGVLSAPLRAAMVCLVLGAVVNLEPETRCAFDQGTRVRGTTGKTARAEAAVGTGYGLRKTAGVGEERRSVTRAPLPPVCLSPDVAPELERIIAKCLEKDRNLRYQHASEIRTDLQRMRRDTDSARVPGCQPV